MARTIQSKAASGSTQAEVEFSADSNGRWDVGFIRVLTDQATQTLLLKQGTTVVGTLTVNSTSAVELKGDSVPVFVGANEGAVTLTLGGNAACQILATAELNAQGQS